MRRSMQDAPQDYPQKIRNPTEHLRGMLKSVEESSVELQHKACLLFLKESSE